jgi:hypothetical protein
MGISHIRELTTVKPRGGNLVQAVKATAPGL